jgi:hypothetical protein
VSVRARAGRSRALSTESIASTVQTPRQQGEACVACGSPLAADQRYCLECGERRAPVSDFLRSGPPRRPAPASPPPQAPPSTGLEAPGAPGRSNTLSLLAGIGVLLLAMGVGVLIGRSGSGSGKPAPAQVISVGSTGTGTSTTAEESFTGDWPSGTKGFTVQLETLPSSGTSVASVAKAKTAASAKGASSVGALKSEEFSSLTAGSYVIYSGVYHKRSEAQKALGSLKKKFPAAKVIEVSEGSASSGGGSKESSGSSGSEGVSSKKAASPKVLESLEHAKGKSYVEKSKALPDVVSTG